MAKKPKAFVDSCVLLDIFNDDEVWYEWASSTLYKMYQSHELVINIIVFTEIAFNFSSHARLEQALAELDIKILDIPIAAAFNVSRIFKQYRKNKGDKKSPMPDFYIGEHAKYLGALLITRDTARYKTYQPKLQLVGP